MAGLSGVVSEGKKLDNHEEILRIFDEVQQVRGVSYVYRHFAADHAAIANFLTGLLPLGAQPAVDATRNSVLFLEGEIFNQDVLLRYAGEIEDRSPCGILLALFLDRGSDFVSLVSGEFNIVIYQGRENRLIILSDHLASMPMYYVKQDGRFLFGSEKKSFLPLLRQSPSIDAVGLLQIVAHVHNLDDRTFLSGVKRLVPATRLIYSGGHLSISCYDRLNFNIPETPRPVEDLCDEWGSRLQNATRLRLEGKQRVLISLSAGLDSRAIACAIPRDFRPVSSRTRGVEGSLEATLAAEIAKRLGFDHFQEEPTAVPPSVIVPKIAWRTECETHFQNGISLSNHSTIKRRGDHIVGGWLGGVTSGAQIFPYMLLPRSRTAFIEQAYRHYCRYSASPLSRVFSPEFLTDNLPNLREAFLASFEHLSATTNVQLYEIWDLYQRQRRLTTSSMPVDSYAFEKIRPFYDKDYVDFTLTIPFRLRIAQSLYQMVIYRLGPEIRDIPNSNTTLRVRGNILGNRANKGRYWTHKAMTKLARRVRPSFRNKIERGRNEDLQAETRQDLAFRRLIEQFIDSPDCDSAVFNRSGIKTMLDEHYQSLGDHADLLGYVATFAAGLPYFVKRTLRCPEEAEPLV